MADIERTLARAIQIGSPEILKRAERIFNMIEDLSPELHSERYALERLYSDDIGKLLFAAYNSNEELSGTIWRDIRLNLGKTIGVTDLKQMQFIQLFHNAFHRSKLPGTINNTNGSQTKSFGLGDAEAAFQLGRMNEYGDGTDVNIQRAIMYYTQAVEDGHPGAAYNLGFFYYSGNGVKQDMKRAYELFDFAAQKGNAASMYNLGVMYENGDYVKKDYTTALYWYSKAVENGYAAAEKDCQRCQNVKNQKGFWRKK